MNNISKLDEGGFTLIELSIVLVIIGLIVGGVLVGQDLIRAAGVRAQISQIEKFNTSANTFRGKYGYLPGDIPDPMATQLGLVARGTGPGEGDGNGVLQYDGGFNVGAVLGETTVFWRDLSATQLIEGSFNTACETVCGSGNPDLSFPQAKIGRGNYVYVWSGGYLAYAGIRPGDSQNYFGLFANPVFGMATISNPGLTVYEAYSIDKKIDDGIPGSGNVLAMLQDFTNHGGASYVGWVGPTDFSNILQTSATPGNTTTCMDNGNIGGNTQQYSISQNNGAYVNCALVFRFQ